MMKVSGRPVVRRDPTARLEGRTLTSLASAVRLAGCALGPPQAPDREARVRDVFAVETGFAKTMRDRDHDAFLAFVAEDAVFLNGGNPLRGKAAIGAFWKRFYTAPEAPFSWLPEIVEVAGSGGLAQSIGPVATPDGTTVSRFRSTWRREADGRWRIVFDNGHDVRECAGAGRKSSNLDRLETPMKRTWTIVAVADVARSLAWYQVLFGQAATAPAHTDFGQLVDTDGTVLLCLHEWGAHEHPTLASPAHAEPGNGLLLFFRVDDFEAALVRARALVARLEAEPALNPGTGTREFSLRDPDGYFVTVSALDAA